MSDITTSLADKVQDKVEDAKETGALYKSEVVMSYFSNMK